MERQTINKQEKMKFIALITRDKRLFRLFDLKTITNIDVEKFNEDPSDDCRTIRICQADCCTNNLKIVSFDFDQFALFINGIGDIFTITTEEI